MRRAIQGIGLALCLMGAWPGVASAQANGDGSYTLAPIGAPLGTGVMTMEITVTVNGKPVTKTVTIPKGAIKAAVPVVCPKRDPDKQTFDEWNKDCLKMKADALAAASQAKAKVMADAINEAFKAEFKIIGAQATTGLKPWPVSVGDRGVMVKVPDTPLGSVTIPGVSVKQGNPLRFTSPGIRGEGGDGGRYNPPPGRSGRSTGSLQPTTPGVTTVAQGVDPLGDPSYVEFGFAGGPIAEVHPTPGMTPSEILTQLAAQLNGEVVKIVDPSTGAVTIIAGVVATFNPGTGALTVGRRWDWPAFVWGDTDVALDFTFTDVDP